jgi:hypothetical protein
VRTIVTGVWKRPEVFELFANNIPSWARVIVVGSEGARSRKMVEEKGFEYIECDNDPLGFKMNKTTLAAKGSDYVICMGSDDVFCDRLWNELSKLMDKGHDIIGLEDLYAYDLNTRNAIYWAGYADERKGATTGVGRCLSKRVMESLNWKCWENNINKGLDSSMTRRIADTLIDFDRKTINIKEKNMFAVDIKSDENITKFRRWPNSFEIDPTRIQEKFNLR